MLIAEVHKTGEKNDRLSNNQPNIVRESVLDRRTGLLRFV